MAGFDIIAKLKLASRHYILAVIYAIGMWHRD